MPRLRLRTLLLLLLFLYVCRQHAYSTLSTAAQQEAAMNMACQQAPCTNSTWYSSMA
jgi:hypothetical protein